MSDTVVLAGHRYAHATALLVDELDTILGRILRNDPHLVLEEESELWWTVTDKANDAVMMRASRRTCERFMAAFQAKHPEATVELPGGLSEWGGSVGTMADARHEALDVLPHSESAQVVLPERERSMVERAMPSSRSESTTEHSWRVAQLATVHPIRPPLEPTEVVAAAIAHLAGDDSA